MKAKLLLTALVVLQTAHVYSQQADFSVGDFDYSINSDSISVSLIALDGLLGSDVVVPDSVSYDGRRYAVSTISRWGNNPAVRTLRLPKTIVGNYASYSSLTALGQIMVDGENPVFYANKGLLIRRSGQRVIVVPSGLKGTLTIPEGVKEFGCSVPAGITKVVVPSTLTFLSASDFTDIRQVEVAEDNPSFCSKAGLLLTKDQRTLVLYPQTDETYITIPATIDSIGPYALPNSSRRWIMERPTPPANYRLSNSYGSSSLTCSGVFVKTSALSAYEPWTRYYTLYGYDFVADSSFFAKQADGTARLVSTMKRASVQTIASQVTDDEGKLRTVTSIAERAFYDTQVTELTIPATITSIGDQGLYAYRLRTLHVEGAPATLTGNVFYSSYSTTLYVPSEQVEAYQAATGWKNIPNMIADDYTKDGMTYKMNHDGTATITKYTGSEKAITIPDVVPIGGRQCRVTAIADNVFANKYLTSVVFPQYLETIGDKAFSYCELSAIDLPHSITSIGNYAFFTYDRKLLQIDGTHYYDIGDEAFGAPGNVALFITPATAAARFKTAECWQDYPICGADAVVDNAGYRRLTEDGKAELVRVYNDSYSSYGTFTVPEQVEIDGEQLTVTAIADSAFYNARVTNITIPATVNTIGTDAFYYYDRSINLSIKGTTPPQIASTLFYSSYWNSPTIRVPALAVDNYKAADGWSQYANYIYALPDERQTLTIGNVVYALLDDSHVAVSKLTATAGDVLAIPATVSSDERSYSVTTVESEAFSSYRPRVLLLPATIDSIANPNYLAHSSVYLQSATPPRLGQSKWVSNTPAMIVPRTAEALYRAYAMWQEAVGADGITTDSILYRIDDDSNATILALLKRTDNTQDATIPQVLTTAEGATATVTALGDYLFRETNFSRLHLPATIASIGKDALPTMYGLRLTCEALTPPQISSQAGIRSGGTLSVYASAISAYSGANVWSQFDIRTLTNDSSPLSYRLLSDGTLEVAALLTDTLATVEVPGTVFSGNEQLTVTSIGNEAFYGHSNVSQVQLPATLRRIGDRAFYGCRLSSIVIPAEVESIGERAFVYSTYSNPTHTIQVRASNPYFTSRNGELLLTKDGKTLLRATNGALWLDYYGANTIDGVETIALGALDGYAPSSGRNYSEEYKNKLICLPASLKSIDAETLKNVYELQTISVDTLSQTLCDVDGVLFSRDTTTVICFPYYRSKTYYNRTTEYELPSKVQTIGPLAFYRTSLESLTLSDSLKTICGSAFQDAGIQYLTLVNEQIAAAEQSSFGNEMYYFTVLYIPMGTINDYRYTYPWNNFNNISSAELAYEDYLLLKAFYEEMGNGASWTRKWNIGDTPEETRITRGIRMNDSHVYSIDLSNNGLEGPLSDKLFYLPALQELNLSGNRLACPVDSVLRADELTGSVLRTLNLSNNQLTGNIGSAGQALKELTTLYAQGNRLTRVSPALPQTITEVDLNSQQMDTVLYANLLRANSADAEAGVPNLLFYNPYSRSFSANSSYLLSATGWLMYLRQAGGSIAPAAYSSGYYVYRQPSGTILQLSDGDYYHIAPVLLTFDMGDVNFDAAVDVADLQLTVNYAVSDTTNTLFNFTAADIVADKWVNVQDVVCLANILLEQDVSDTATDGASRSLTASIRPAEAVLYWRDNQLILQSDRDVAAMDVVLTGAGSVKWLLSSDDYDYGLRTTGQHTHIVHYSVAGNVIKAGETVVAEVTGENPVTVSKLTLVDRDARPISAVAGATTDSPTGVVDTPTQTGMTLQSRDHSLYLNTSQAIRNLRWSVYTLSGALLGAGSATSLPAGTHRLDCSTDGQQQVVVRIVSDSQNTTRKIATK